MRNTQRATPDHHHHRTKFLWCLTGMCRTSPPSHCTFPRATAPPHVQHHTRTSEATCKAHAQRILMSACVASSFRRRRPYHSQGLRLARYTTRQARRMSGPYLTLVPCIDPIRFRLIFAHPEYELHMAEPARVVVLKLAP